MRQAGEGRIIQNSSVLGFAAMKFRGAYNASKFALEGLTDTLRLELRDTHIYVVLVEPGPITSEFRKTAYKYFQRNIRPELSAHKNAYNTVANRLSSDGTEADSKFTLSPDAVADKVILALESASPNARYGVTFPTHLFAVLRRLLPTKVLDYILNKAG